MVMLIDDDYSALDSEIDAKMLTHRPSAPC